MQTEHVPLQGLFFHEWGKSYIPNILHEIYYERIYLPLLVGKLDIIVDFGANIGITSFYFKDFAKQIYAVEPSALHLEALKKMIEFNGIKNIKVCPYAISNTTGTTRFYHNDSNTTMFSIKDKVNNKGDYEEVETLTVEDFMKRENISKVDLLKLDLESFESEVFASDGFKSVCEKIKTIIFEYHDWTNASKDLVVNTLRDLGYEVRWLRGTEASIGVATRI